MFKPTTQVKREKNIIGFDIETYDDNRKFYCGSLWHPYWCKTFFDKRSLIDFIASKPIRQSIICASNLLFDFFGTYYNHPEEKQFRLLFRGSNLLWARTYTDNNKYNIRGKKPLLFLDTRNFAALSVEKLGKLINIPKLTRPKALGRLPETSQEKYELVTYNKRDAEISARSLMYLYDSFFRLGSSRRHTLASTAMSLYTNRYLTKTYHQHSVPVMDEQFIGYYGGRCEAFMRGRVRDCYYYDVNSLYPYVMTKEYPNPNTLRVTHKNRLDDIYDYEGMSLVSVSCPDMTYPLLPYRLPDKLIFPVGTFTGWYTHGELRKALDIGYTIKNVKKTFYYTETCHPFKGYVTDLYNKRLQFMEDENTGMAYITKILMNALYGKFGQKYRNRDNIIPFNHSKEEIEKYDFFEPIQGTNYVRVKNEFNRPAPFIMPIWALTVTANARLHMYDYLKRSEAMYTDTDSLITTRKFPESSELGKLKCEAFIEDGVIVRPKFYGFKNNWSKIKGLSRKMSYDQFLAFLENPHVEYDKFLKFREALRRRYVPNEIIPHEKSFSLEDSKRVWLKPFNVNDLQTSKPIMLHGAETPKIVLLSRV